MMSPQISALPPLKSIGKPLDLSPETFGFLTDSSGMRENGDQLRRRLADDGYLYLPGALERDRVIAARGVITHRLRADNLLDPHTDPIEGVLRADSPNPYFRPDVTKDNPPLLEVIYGDPMIGLFARIFDAPVRHFDFTWFRAVGPGPGTQPHCDVVYMGRGTDRLLTAWTPFGDIGLDLGGLMILENSHRRTDVLGEYQKQDVDSFCENGPNREKILSGKMNWEHWQNPEQEWNGAITDDPILLQQTLGGRWLTAPEYRMGDVLIFTMRTVHASIDNNTQRIRLSSDSRYLPASEAADERWITPPGGGDPIAHGIGGKRGRIC